jgi:hypothetical protein
VLHDEMRTPGVDREFEEDMDEEHIEELFGQLWAVPIPEKPRVRRPEHGSKCLFWVRKDLVRDHKIRPEDFFLVGIGLRIVEVPVTMSWSRDI